MERLKHMKDSLMACVEGQMGNLNQVDAKELGEVIDMIKDLSEAEYYCAITEAMNSKDKEEKHNHYYFQEPAYYRDMDRDNGRMYYGNEQLNYARGDNGNNSGGNRNYTERQYPMMDTMHDQREGKSPKSRRMYMEAKETQQDKTIQLRELEKYMQELTQDLVEMIGDSSREEKQYLEKRLVSLANKIGQMNG